MFLLGTTPGYQKVFHEVMLSASPDVHPTLPSWHQPFQTQRPSWAASPSALDMAAATHSFSQSQRRAIHALQQTRVKMVLLLTARDRKLMGSRASPLQYWHCPWPCMILGLVRLWIIQTLIVQYKAKEFRGRFGQMWDLQPQRTCKFWVFMIQRKQNWSGPLMFSLTHKIHAQRTMNRGLPRRKMKELSISSSCSSEGFWSNRYGSRAELAAGLFKDLRNWVCATYWILRFPSTQQHTEQSCYCCCAVPALQIILGTDWVFVC